MTPIRTVLEQLFLGLAGALLLYCAKFDLPGNTKLFLYFTASLLVMLSLVSLVNHLPGSQVRSQTMGGGLNNKLLLGLVGALMLYCAQFFHPGDMKLFLYFSASLLVAVSLVSLVNRLPRSEIRSRTTGGGSNQEGLAEVQEGNPVSASAERGSHSGPSQAEAAESAGEAGKVDLAKERQALATMIEHHPTKWWTPRDIAADVRLGVHCHPECQFCEVDRQRKATQDGNGLPGEFSQR